MEILEAQVLQFFRLNAILSEFIPRLQRSRACFVCRGLQLTCGGPITLNRAPHGWRSVIGDLAAEEVRTGSEPSQSAGWKAICHACLTSLTGFLVRTSEASLQRTTGGGSLPLLPKPSSPMDGDRNRTQPCITYWFEDADRNVT